MTTPALPALPAPTAGSALSSTCVCFHLRRAARAVTQTYERALAPSGLQPGQFSLLTVLHRSGPRPLSVLAELMGMDRTTLTRNIRPLERDGLVRVKAGDKQDQRIRRVGLTAAGEKRWQEAEPLWAQAHRHMVEGLGDGWPALRDQLTSAIAAAGHPAGTL
jgi:DNA-binding MarR family transcriptional regulator